MTGRDTQHFRANRLTGIGDFVLGNRISYQYDLKGPRFVHMDSVLIIAPGSCGFRRHFPDFCDIADTSTA